MTPPSSPVVHIDTTPPPQPSSSSLQQPLKVPTPKKRPASVTLEKSNAKEQKPGDSKVTNKKKSNAKEQQLGDSNSNVTKKKKTPQVEKRPARIAPKSAPLIQELANELHTAFLEMQIRMDSLSNIKKKFLLIDGRKIKGMGTIIQNFLGVLKLYDLASNHGVVKEFMLMNKELIEEFCETSRINKQLIHSESESLKLCAKAIGSKAESLLRIIEYTRNHNELQHNEIEKIEAFCAEVSAKITDFLNSCFDHERKSLQNDKEQEE